MEFMNITLYELTTSYMQALDFLTDPENEVDNQAATDTMEGLDGSIDFKMLNIGRFIATIEHQAEGIEAVEKKAKARRQALEKKAAWLRDYLKTSMTTTGKNALTSGDITIKLAKLPVSVQVDDESLIPVEFWKEKIERSIDKTLIKTLGGCAGVRIESGGFRVAIK
jgi:hypothetical protein